MYQQFDLGVDKSQGGAHLPLLRGVMEESGIDAFYVTHADEYRNEYLPECGKRLQWLTGFTGSAGAAVVTAETAAVFVDGRYTLQVREQVDAQLFEFGDLIAEGPERWLADAMQPGQRLGVDPNLHSIAHYESLQKLCREKGIELVVLEGNPIDACWENRPAPSGEPMMTHGTAYSGESAESKRRRLAETLAETGISAAVLTRPESVAWLLNVRGRDVEHTPVCMARAILHDDGSAAMFIDPQKVTPELREHLGGDVAIFDGGHFTERLVAMAAVADRLLIDPEHASAGVFLALTGQPAELVRGDDPCAEPRACKNPTELENARKAHIRDGVALTRFLAWFDETAPRGALDEVTAARRLEELRIETGELVDLSFDTISAAGPNAALPHYRPTNAANRRIGSGAVYLVDSGGQYPDGTTDVTRTVIVGEPTAEMKARFTEVLKGHIAVSRCRFPAGTNGMQIDTLARHALWQSGFDYGHGTGHGVGSFLGVHEGPQSISTSLAKGAGTPLKAGMIVSNEPGYYREGEYGIRTENLLAVTPAEPLPGGETPMHGFETLTLAPIDIRLVDAALLTEGEKDWLNDYHRTVRDTLGPLLDEAARQWLEHATRAV